jgi:glycosyltransferase involved in cell wall biosynthesis
MKTFLSLFNLTHSGSRKIYDSLILEIIKSGHPILLDTSHEVPNSNSSKIYRVNYESSRFKWLKKLLIEQILIPYICHKEKIEKIVLFGNIPVLLLKIEQVVYFHNLLYIENFKRDLKASINKYLFSILVEIKRPRFLVQSEYVQKKIENLFNLPGVKVIKSAITYQKSGFQCAGARQLDHSDQINIIYPSFPYFYKNHAFLLENVNLFQELNLHLWMTCDPKDIKTQIKSPNLHFLGSLSVKELEIKYKNMHAIINTSEFESLGMYLLEAVSLKIPLISTNKDYVTSTIKDFYSFEHKNNNALKNALITFKRDLIYSTLKIPKSESIDSPKNVLLEILL